MSSWKTQISIEPIFLIKKKESPGYLKASKNIKKTRLVEDPDVIINAPVVIQNISSLPDRKTVNIAENYRTYKTLMEKAVDLKENFERFITEEIHEIDRLWYRFIESQLGDAFTEEIREKFEKKLIYVVNKMVNEILPDTLIIELVAEISITSKQGKVQLSGNAVDINPKSISIKSPYIDIEKDFLNLMKVKDQKYLDPIRAFWPDLFTSCFYVHEHNLANKPVNSDNHAIRVALAKKYMKQEKKINTTIHRFQEEMLKQKIVDGYNTEVLFDVSYSSLNRMYQEAISENIDET